MELSGSNIKKCLNFGKRKPRKKFFVFQETETLKSFLYFGKSNFLNPRSNNKKNPPRKKFLIFQEISYIFSKESFSYISGNGTLHFSAQDRKIKKNPPEKISDTPAK